MPPYFLFFGGSTTAFFTDKEHQQNIKKISKPDYESGRISFLQSVVLNLQPLYIAFPYVIVLKQGEITRFKVIYHLFWFSDNVLKQCQGYPFSEFNRTT